ncbi:MAG: thioredoxin family protein [Phycisphaerales bacterium]
MPTRPSRRMLPLAASLLLAGAFGTAASGAPASPVWFGSEPEVFSDRGFDADRAAATDAGKLHLVYATASWCPPCQQMKKTTWVDERVEGWLGRHAVVTALDVDEFRPKAQSLRVRAMPTMMLFDGDEELGRIQGYRDAEGLLAWLESTAGDRVDRAATPAQPTQDDANGADGEPAAVPEPGADAGAGAGARLLTVAQLAAEVQPIDDESAAAFDRLAEARALLAADDLDAATDAYAELWSDTREGHEAFQDERRLRMADEIATLAARHPAAMTRFRAIHKAEDLALKNRDASWDGLRDWLLLNRVVGREAVTARYAGLVADRPNAGVTFDRFQGELVDQVLRADRSGLVPQIVPNPVDAAERGLKRAASAAALADADFADDPELLAHALLPAVAGALLADDDGEAEQDLIEALGTAFGDDDAWRAAFIAIAGRVGRLTDEHRAWIAGR